VHAGVNCLGHGVAKRAVSGSGDGMLHSVLSEAQSVRRRKCARGESRRLAGRGWAWSSSRRTGRGENNVPGAGNAVNMTRS
jgi:hypothetical protein